MHPTSSLSTQGGMRFRCRSTSSVKLSSREVAVGFELGSPPSFTVCSMETKIPGYSVKSGTICARPVYLSAYHISEFGLRRFFAIHLSTEVIRCRRTALIQIIGRQWTAIVCGCCGSAPSCTQVIRSPESSEPLGWFDSAHSPSGTEVCPAGYVNVFAVRRSGRVQRCANRIESRLVPVLCFCPMQKRNSGYPE